MTNAVIFEILVLGDFVSCNSMTELLVDAESKKSSIFDDVSDVQDTLDWLRLPERVEFKVADMAYRVLHGLAPPYLSQLTRVADLPGRRRLRSSSSQSLLVPSFRRSTVGRRSVPVAASVLWNSLPLDIPATG